MSLTPAYVLRVYLHPRDEKGNLRLEPAGGQLSSEFEQFRRFCAARGVTDGRTVERRYGEWQKARSGATRPADGRPAPG